MAFSPRCLLAAECRCVTEGIGARIRARLPCDKYQWSLNGALIGALQMRCDFSHYV